MYYLQVFFYTFAVILQRATRWYKGEGFGLLRPKPRKAKESKYQIIGHPYSFYNHK